MILEEFLSEKYLLTNLCGEGTRSDPTDITKAKMNKTSLVRQLMPNIKVF